MLQDGLDGQAAPVRPFPRALPLNFYVMILSGLPKKCHGHRCSSVSIVTFAVCLIVLVLCKSAVAMDSLFFGSDLAMYLVVSEGAGCREGLVYV